MVASSQPLGIIYPLPLHWIDRFLRDKKRVFVKPPSHNKTSRLFGCRKLMFYASEGEGGIVGEARIDEISLKSVDGVLREFRDELFLSEEELRSYLGSEDEKRVLVFVISKPVRYPHPVKLDPPLTTTGEYLSAEEYRRRIRPEE
jgi:hypothetical protein